MSESLKNTEDILLVEDSSTYVEAFKKMLSHWDFTYSVITDGLEAWERLQTKQPRILLLDWNLPGMDGINICRKLRSMKTSHYVFVIMLTSNSKREDFMTGFDAGADDYMTKPYDSAVLQAKIKVGFRISDLEKKIAQEVMLLERANEKQTSLIRAMEEKNRIITQQTQEIKEAQKQLIEVARCAGMAEIATSVLHNVGNLLNTAVTSSTVIREAVEASRFSTLKKLSDLLNQNGTHFLEFVQRDPRGANIPEFLHQLTGVLDQERTQIRTKLESLSESHDQIRQIIALQQSYAGLSGVKETLSVPALVEDATKLFVESFKKYDINIVYEFDPSLPEIAVEKHKALQILVNLLRNARDAIKDLECDDRSIWIVGQPAKSGYVSIVITDNGVGIKPENLARIFNFGFTTKKDGHGFGLHGCANLAKELGGSLTVTSDGEGQGASLTLTIPCK